MAANENAPFPWTKTRDGTTCWLTDESCKACGGLLATNGTLKWCAQGNHDLPPAA